MCKGSKCDCLPKVETRTHQDALPLLAALWMRSTVAIRLTISCVSVLVQEMEEIQEEPQAEPRTEPQAELVM